MSKESLLCFARPVRKTGRELGELVEKGVLLRHGESGKNIFYTLARTNAS
jgi:hypothetical protein